MNKNKIFSVLVLLITGLPLVQVAASEPSVAAPGAKEVFVAKGLAWETGLARKMTWDAARADCQKKGMFLPDHNDLLMALLRYPEVRNPEGRYWAAGVDAFDPNKAWYTEYSEKELRSEVKTAPKSEENLVRCVRKAD